MRIRPPAREGVALAATLCALAIAAPASAGGLYFSDRGVRPLGRAGAFIAGGDDLGAIAYNPAGIYDAGTQFLIDGAWMDFNAEYTRQALVQQVDPNTHQPTGSFNETLPTVHGTTPFLPIPTIAISHQLGSKLVGALGVWAPYAAIPSYPQQISVGGATQPGPQRYSLVTLNGSALALIGAALAYAPVKELRLGVTGGVLTGKFTTTSVFSGCVPDRFFCAPEDPNWDVLGQLTVSPIIAPTGSAGAIWIPHPSWRIGFTGQLPVYVRAGAQLETRLPAAPVFQNASQVGQSASVAFDLPWTLHAGVETRAIENLRLEVGAGMEAWSMHHDITVTPDHIALQNVTGFPATYYVAPITIPRDFKDSYSVRLGGEYALKLFGHDWDARAGVSYETSAVPNAYESVLTLDSDKVTASLGGSLHLGKWRLDAVYAHVFAADVNVAPGNAAIPQISPVQANPSPNPDTVNGGHYAARADVFGLGLAYTFEAAPADPEAPAAPPAKAKP